MSVCKYLITQKTIARFLEEGRQVARAILEGSVIAGEGKALEEDKLVAVQYEEKTILLFAQDIRSRGEQID